MDILNDKYKDIVAGGKELFWRYGIKKVTVEEICEKAGTSRVTFYKYFQNKVHLAHSILKGIMDQSFNEYREIMNSNEDFEVKVKKTILLKIKYSSQMSYEFVNDIMGGDFPEIHEYMDYTREESFKMVENDYREAQQKGYIRKDVKIEFIIYYLNKMMEMVSDPQLEQMYDDTSELISELIRFLYYGLLPGKPEK